jgi:hypothetical protein
VENPLLLYKQFTTIDLEAEKVLFSPAKIVLEKGLYPPGLVYKQKL